MLPSLGNLDSCKFSIEEDLRFWRDQVLRYFRLKRLSIGLNEAEQHLLDGLQGTVDSLTGQ